MSDDEDDSDQLNRVLEKYQFLIGNVRLDEAENITQPSDAEGINSS